MSEDTKRTSPFQHHHPRTQPIKANHKYRSPICIQPSLRALVSNGYAFHPMFSVWAPSTPVRTPGCCLGTGTTAGGGFATTAACLLMNVCLERSQVLQKSFDVRNHPCVHVPHKKQTNAAWDMIFAVRERGVKKKGEWMEVHTFYLKKVLDYASHTKRTPVTTNYPCPLSRPTSAGFACLTCKCYRKK